MEENTILAAHKVKFRFTKNIKYAFIGWHLIRLYFGIDINLKNVFL